MLFSPWSVELIDFSAVTRFMQEVATGPVLIVNISPAINDHILDTMHVLYIQAQKKTDG